MQQLARAHRRSTEEEVREILRIAARFAAVGLTGEIPELRGHPVQPAEFE